MGRRPSESGEQLLIRCLLADPVAAKGLWRTWRANTDLCDLKSGAASVLPLFGDELHGWLEDDAEKHLIIGIRKHAWSLNHVRLHELSTAAEHLRADGIQSLVTGAAASALLLPGRTLPVWRPALLVRKSVAKRAVLRLNAMGWQGDELNEDTLNTYNGVELERAGGGSIGLRWQLFPCPFHLRQVLETLVWQTSRGISWSGKSLGVPAPALHLLEVLSRGETWDAVHLCEALLLIAGEETDWELFRNATALSFQPHIVRSSLAYLRKRWSAGVPRSLTLGSGFGSTRPYRQLYALGRDYRQWISRTEAHPGSRAFLDYLCRRWNATHVFEIPWLACERLLGLSARSRAARNPRAG